MINTSNNSVALSNNNTNSLYNKYSRFVGGGSAETANGFIEWWESYIFEKDSTDRTYAVENAYENDLYTISSIFYDDFRWWWLIALYNNIIDPLTEVTAGRILLLPTKERAQLMVSGTTGGTESTRKQVSTITPIIS